MAVKRLGGRTVWVGYPATGGLSRMVIGTVRSLVLKEIGTTERKFEYARGKKGDRGDAVSISGKGEVWTVVRMDLLTLGTGDTENFAGKKGARQGDGWYEGR